MFSSNRLLKAVLLLHLYLGVFITPALIFFAFTGLIQTFNLHETTRGSTYQPPKILVQLGQLHKKQTLVVPIRKPQPPEPAARPAEHAASTPAQPPAPQRKAKNLLPMKLFFALVSVGLFVSTLTGLLMAYRFARNNVLITALLSAGIVIPVLLTFF